MSADLKVIHPEPVGEDVVKILEEALVEARAGNISMAAIAMVARDGSSWTMRSKVHSFVSLLGAVELVKHRILKAFDDAC